MYMQKQETPKCVTSKARTPYIILIVVVGGSFSSNTEVTPVCSLFFIYRIYIYPADIYKACGVNTTEENIYRIYGRLITNLGPDLKDLNYKYYIF